MELNYGPFQISELYLDDQDMYGLFWWAEKIKEQTDKINPK